ncbi:kinase-like domain-containing protein [Ilyonectria destructans]|nr:kinase-like domain-containing protein [Ilyonectria destructans]
MSEATSATYSGMGTPGYRAPESMGDRPVFSTRSNVYSLGCLLYNLCAYSLPSPTALLSSPIPAEYPEKLRTVIMRCLEQDPSSRPASRDVVAQILAACIDVLALPLATQLERQAGDTSRLSDNQGITEDMAILTLDSAHQPDLQPPRPILTKQQHDDLNNELLDACIEGDECFSARVAVSFMWRVTRWLFAVLKPSNLHWPVTLTAILLTPSSGMVTIAPLVQPSSLLAAANFPNDHDLKVSEALASCRFRVRGYGL